MVSKYGPMSKERAVQFLAALRALTDGIIVSAAYSEPWLEVTTTEPIDPDEEKQRCATCGDDTYPLNEVGRCSRCQTLFYS